MDKISRANSLLKEAAELLNPTNASTGQSSGSSESSVVRLVAKFNTHRSHRSIICRSMQLSKHVLANRKGTTAR